jgi:L-asparaginase II
MPVAESDALPVLAELVRGGFVESRHHGAFAVVDSAGGVVHAAGDIERPVFPRSAVKPLQALPLIETGAADALGLSVDEIAIACASHGGEPVHVATVERFLARAGLDAGDLECGAHLPTDPASSQALIRAGRAPSALHNNCSGKHAGFLCTARHRGERTRGYIAADHPVQARVLRAVAEMTGTDMARMPRGIDGCGIPVVGVPLRGLALGMARMADPSGLGDARGRAARRILDAMAAAPLLVDGTGGMTTLVMQIAGAAVRLKPGAEGVFCAALPLAGLGVALKIADGAKRAAEIAMAALLDRLGCFGPAERMALHPFLEPRLRNAAGIDVGSLRPGPVLLQDLV